MIDIRAQEDSSLDTVGPSVHERSAFHVPGLALLVAAAIAVLAGQIGSTAAPSARPVPRAFPG